MTNVENDKRQRQITIGGLYMARPKSNTVLYFAHDVDASSRKTLTVIENNFGNAGYAFWYKLLEWLGGSSEEHCFDARKTADLEFISNRCGSDVETGTKILQKLADVGAIDSVLWDHRIIWCQNFIDRLTELYKRRSRELPVKPSYCNNNCHHKGVIVENEGVSVTITPQSKVNETKVNKTTENKTTTEEKTPVVMVSVINADDFVYKAYTQHIGELTPVIRENIKAALTKYLPSWIADACKEAANKPHDRTWPYILGILQNWKREGKVADNGLGPPGAADKYFEGKFSHLVLR
jgi:DnaD/phage-associated family protein